MKNNQTKIIGIIIITLAILVLLFFLSQDMAWTGKLEFKTDFKKFTPFISILKPQNQIEIGNMAYIKKAPVWFDIYMPRDFESAKLEFVYKNDYNYKIEVGPKIYEDNNPLQILEENAGTAAQSDIYKTKSLEFDLTNMPIRLGKLRFMISVPDLTDEQKGIYIKELRVQLNRKQIWQEGIIKNLTNYFNYYKNEFK